MLVRLLLALLLLAAPAWGRTHSNECEIDFALPEQIGPPTSSVVSVGVIPYTASASYPGGGKLRLCVATDANKDDIGKEWQTAPGTVTCGTADTSWAAAELTVLQVSGLSANTTYWYKVQCDVTNGAGTASDPADWWGSRPVNWTKTLPTAGADTDFTVTVESDSHIAAPTGTGGQLTSGNTDVLWLAVGNNGQALGESDADILRDITWMQRAWENIRERRPTVHWNLGDFYYGDGFTANNAGWTMNRIVSPACTSSTRTVGSLSVQAANTCANQWTGWPTRVDTTTTVGGGILEQNVVDNFARERYGFKVWLTSWIQRDLLRNVWQGVAWGNHDYSYRPGRSDARFGDRNTQLDGTKLDDEAAAGWASVIVNPNQTGFYLPTSGECDTAGTPGVPACPNRGQWYRVSMGKAEFWVINPYEGTGGAGSNTTDTPWNLSRQFAEGPDDWSLGTAQWNWLNETYTNSTAKWKFILAHNAVGGNDRRPTVGYNQANWYASFPLWPAGAFCDDGAGAGIAGDHIRNGTEKLCNNDSVQGGVTEADALAIAGSSTRVAGWEQANGICAAGVRCEWGNGLYTPYSARTNNLLGSAANGGQQTIQTLMEANIETGGANFFVSGHDHISAASCRWKTDGCSEVWYYNVPQLYGDSTTSPSQPFGGINNTAAPLLWSYGYDYNGDGVPDYRTEGQGSFTTPVDVAAGTRKQAGMQRSGYATIDVSNEGVKFQAISNYKLMMTSDYNQPVWTWDIGHQATTETDFDGSAAADAESKRSATTPTVTGTGSGIDCDATSSPLEGAQSCSVVHSGTALSVAASSAGIFSLTGLTCADWAWQPLANAPSVSTIGAMFRFRNSTTLYGGVRMFPRDDNAAACPPDPAGGTCGNASPTVDWWIGLIAQGGQSTTVPTATSPQSGFWMTNGTTYQMRYCYDPANDDGEIWVDACDPGDDDCDGKMDSGGAAVAIPTWGAGTAYHDTLNGSGSGLTLTNYIFGTFGAGVNGAQFKFDSLGICDINTGAFKCGDGYE